MTQPAGQFSTLRVAACQCHLAADEDQRQGVLARSLEERPHGPVLGESERLLRQIVALNVRSLLLHPLDIGGERYELLIDIHAAHSGPAAHRGLKNLDHFHLSALLFQVGSEAGIVIKAGGQSLEQHRVGFDS